MGGGGGRRRSAMGVRAASRPRDLPVFLCDLECGLQLLLVDTARSRARNVPG